MMRDKKERNILVPPGMDDLTNILYGVGNEANQLLVPGDRKAALCIAFGCPGEIAKRVADPKGASSISEFSRPGELGRTWLLSRGKPSGRDAS